MKNRTVCKIVSVILLSFACTQVHAQSKLRPSVNFTQTPAEANDFVNYRGQRKPVESEDFYAQEVTAGNCQQEALIITVQFNQMVNPKSITTENVSARNSRAYAVTDISFNKEGTKVRITVKGNISFPVSLSMTEVQSYNAKVLSLNVENIHEGETLRYNKEAKQWKRF